MRLIKSELIKKTVKELCIKANIELRKDILRALKSARKREISPKPKKILDIIIKNAMLARRKKVPICQDTGMVVAYVKLGQDVKIEGDLNKAIEGGVKDAYKQGYFRKSIVRHPLKRDNTNTNLPPILNFRIIPGERMEIKIGIKGFGCENASRTKMFRPTDSIESIEHFVVETLKKVGSNACPPMYIGIGIGGTLDKAVALSKEAVFREVGKFNKEPQIAKLERSILNKINRLKIGPMGMGGKTTVLGVSILTYPTHIAGLPVAINISCHAVRDARKII